MAAVGSRRGAWTSDAVIEGLIRFYSSLDGLGLMFPSASNPTAVEAGQDLLILRPIVGAEFVEVAAAALADSREFSEHLFRECWARSNKGRLADLSKFGWDPIDHTIKVERAAIRVAKWHNARILRIDRGRSKVSDSRHGRSVVTGDPSQHNSESAA